MSDYISWYMVELRTRLAPHLATTRVESIIREAESHLKESSEAIRNDLAIPAENAALAAIDAFGSPEKVALTHLRETNMRILGMKPVWLVLLSAFFALLCWNFHWLSLSGPFDNFGATWQNGLAGFVGVLAIVGFIAGCRAGRRSYRGPLALLSVQFLIGSLLFGSFFAVSSGGFFSKSVLRYQIAGAAQELPKSLERLDKYKDFVVEGKKLFASAKTVADLPEIYRNPRVAEKAFDSNPGPGMLQAGSTEYVIPYHTVYAMPDGRFWGIDSISSLAEAKKTWSAVDDTTLPSIAYERLELTSLLVRVHEAQSGRLFFPNARLVSETTSWTIVFLPGLFIIDWLTFALIRKKRAWPVRGIA